MSHAQKKIITACLGALLFYSAVGFFIIFPIQHQVDSFSRNLFMQKSVLKLLQDQITTLENFQKNYPIYEQQFRKIDKAFIDLEVPINFVEYLEERAAANDVAADIRPTAVISGKKGKPDISWQSLGFQIALKGDIQDCQRYAEEIESGPWFVDLRQLNLMKTKPVLSSEQEKDSFAQLNFSFNAYSFTSSTASK